MDEAPGPAVRAEQAQQRSRMSATAARTCLSPDTVTGLDALLCAPVPDAGNADGIEDGQQGRAGPPLLAIRSGTGPARLQSVGEEAEKLGRIRALTLLSDLFDGVPARVLLAYRGRDAWMTCSLLGK